MGEVYREAMDHIIVTDEMRKRILKNLRDTEPEKGKASRWFIPSRYFAAAACFVLVVIGAASLTYFYAPLQQENPSGIQNGIPDMVEAASLDELSQLVGFEIEALEQMPFQAAETRYTAYQGEMAEVRYCGEEQTIVFRKAAGKTDPSGDYTAYPDTLLLEMGDYCITLKGEEQKFSLAVWQDGGYSYSVRSTPALSQTQWEQLLQTVVSQS